MYIWQLPIYQSQKSLCITFVRSQLTYCSQLWNSYLIKDIIILEKIQRQATKFILSNFNSDYRTRLLKLPLMYILNLYKVLFFIKALKQPWDHFIIQHHVSFSTNSTRSTFTNKLNHIYTPTVIILETFTSTDYQEYGINYHLLI